MLTVSKASSCYSFLFEDPGPGSCSLRPMTAAFSEVRLLELSSGLFARPPAESTSLARVLPCFAKDLVAPDLNYSKDPC